MAQSEQERELPISSPSTVPCSFCFSWPKPTALRRGSSSAPFATIYISSPPEFSLSCLPSLSFSLSLISLSLTLYRPPSIKVASSSAIGICLPARFRGSQLVKPQLGGDPGVVVAWMAGACSDATSSDVLHCSPASFGNHSCPKMLSSLFSSQWYPLFAMKVPRSSTRFSVQNNKLCQLIRAKWSLFWGNDLEFLLIVKNTFQQYIICLYLKSFAKKTRFLRHIVKLTIKILPHFACRANQDSESGFETTLGLFLTS